MKFSIVFGFRNRETIRVKRCLDSLERQSNTDFEVLFVDYGSDENCSFEIKQLCFNYSFVRYVFNNTRGMPWNRSHALNTGLKLAAGDYIIFGDVDLIYPVGFIKELNSIDLNNKLTFGSFILLPENYDYEAIDFRDKLLINLKSVTGAGAINIIERNKLFELNGFDEFYCFWGAEDRDLRQRLSKIGVEESYLTPEVSALHQWHPLTSNMYTSGFPLQWWEDMNIHFYKNFNVIKRNEKGWGRLLTKEERTSLNADFILKTIPIKCSEWAIDVNGKYQIIELIYSELRNLKGGERVRFEYQKKENNVPNQPWIKTIFNKAVIIKKSQWYLISNEYEKYKKRMLYFIPEEDLIYIFWKIIQEELQYDYSFERSNEKLTWVFSPKV